MDFKWTYRNTGRPVYRADNTNITLENEDINWFWSNADERILRKTWEQSRNLELCSKETGRPPLECHLHLLDLYLRGRVQIEQIIMK